VRVTSEGIPVEALISVIKASIRRAGVSRSNDEADLQISSVRLTLQVLASKAAGGRLSFQVPFIGMTFSAGAKVTSQDTHTIVIDLAPPKSPRQLVRGGEVEDALVDAIATIKETMVHAAEGDDPWVLSTGTVDMSFAVTRSGEIELGLNGELSSEIRQSLTVSLVLSPS
jgi:hypothetical protein